MMGNTDGAPETDYSQLHSKAAVAGERVTGIKGDSDKKHRDVPRRDTIFGDLQWARRPHSGHPKEPVRLSAITTWARRPYSAAVTAPVFPTQTPHPRSRTIWDSGPNTSMITPYSQERIGQIKKIDRFRLTKLLYGLKQAGRRLQEELHEHPRAHGFERLPSDKCLFKVTKKRSDLDKSYSGEEVETLIIGIYVDDTQRSRLDLLLQ